ncbi:MAG: PQQ-binding-like beta-propeller repeat protein [Planctomycetaceae bacterium]|nr:PQQ-binding-like beta-propeller repeat protein [Planctomycetaceae bacterium]MBT6487186.1 PQQ-binding-like beta-propeller repeat protein [Planctomycetaceae bacterium]
MAVMLPIAVIAAAPHGFTGVTRNVLTLFAQTLSANNAPAAEEKSADDSKTDEQAEAQRRVFGHLLYRSRRQQLLLSRAMRHLDEGKTTDALLYLQTIFDLPEDSFTWLGDESRLVSIRAESMRVLGSQPSAVLRSYERLHRAEADIMLVDARSSGDPVQFRNLGQRYYFTAAGFAAIDWQASRWFDLGKMGQAARAWQRLVSEPAHSRRVTRPMLLKTAIALQLAGRTSDAKTVMQRLGDGGMILGDGTVADIAWLQQHVAQPSLLAQLSKRSIRPGRNDAQTVLQATTPFLSPLWSQSYTAGPDEVLTSLVADWEQRQRENLKPIAVANSAIVADRSIILRDFGSIRAFNAVTGEPHWSYQCATSLKSVSRDSLNRTASRSGSVRSTSIDVPSAFATNATTGMLSTDGQRVYAVDYVDLARQPRSPSRFTRAAESPPDEAPKLISRNANRLIALQVNPEATDSDSRDGHQRRPIWSIGGAVGTPEWFVRMDADADGRVTKEEFNDPVRLFSKIDTNDDNSIGLREAAASAGLSERGNPLWGHFFLGAPLAVDGRLYVVTEADRQLNLVALRPETGELLWSQAMGFVEVPIERDANRYPLQCTPSFADGVLVCSTQLGFLVGIDSSTGSLMWAYYYGDDQSLSRLGRWPHRPQSSFGHAGFPSVVHIADDRVVVLPRQSNSIHCLDLKTGKRVWTGPRQDAEYIGTLHGDHVLTVGSRFCRSLSIKTGQELWATRLGMPSGCGVQAGENYLVPLEEGRIATLDISSGREIGFTIARQDRDEERTSDIDRDNERVFAKTDELQQWTGDWHPGNLVAVGELVLSAGANRLVAFPQAGPLLSSIERDFQNQPLSGQAKVRAAELNLALGDMNSARTQLTEVLAETMPPSEVEWAETLLRELLYLQLRHQSGNNGLFAQLAQLSKTPVRRGRYLMQRAEAQLKRGDFSGVLQSTRDFSALNLNQPLPTVGDPSLRVTAASWVRSIVGRVQSQFGDTQLAEIVAHIDQEQQLSLAADGTGRLERFLTVYSQWPQADRIRNDLARRYIAAGRFQQAELLLLINRRSPDHEVALQSTAMLAGLWDRLGLWHEAAGLLKEIEEQSADVNVSDGTSTRELLPEFSPSGLTAYALKQRVLPEWEISRVDIFQRPWTEIDPHLAETYGRYRRRFPTKGNSTFQLLVKGSSGTEKLAVIDRHTGRIVSNIPIPQGVSYPTTQHMADVGHFVPLGGQAAVNGISLLRGDAKQPLWTTKPQGLASPQEVLRVGPAGPSFCSFQARRHLVVTDPGSGRILWQRTDLDPRGGLLNDPYAGLFGDDNVLVLFAADRSSYTVYKSATGEILRTGRLDIEVNQQRRVFGRKLCYVARTEKGLRIRIWDPLHDRIEFDEPFEGRLYSAVTPNQELAVILPPGRLVILDVAANQKRLDFQLDPADLANLNYMRIFNGNGRYFVNLQRAIRVPPSRTYSYYASDTFLDAVHVQGELLAINREHSKLEWKRTLPQRSVMRTPQYRLPFLITMSGVRDRWNGNRQSLLVEVIDEATGETIGLKTNLRPDRIVQCTYQPEHSRIRFYGLKTLFDLKFDRARQRISTEDRPL